MKDVFKDIEIIRGSKIKLGKCMILDDVISNTIDEGTNKPIRCVTILISITELPKEIYDSMILDYFEQFKNNSLNYNVNTIPVIEISIISPTNYKKIFNYKTYIKINLNKSSIGLYQISRIPNLIDITTRSCKLYEIKEIDNYDITLNEIKELFTKLGKTLYNDYCVYYNSLKRRYYENVPKAIEKYFEKIKE